MPDGDILLEIKEMLSSGDLSTKDALRLNLRATMSLIEEVRHHTHPEFRQAWWRDVLTAAATALGAVFIGSHR